MNDSDIKLRIATYRTFIELGRAPVPKDVSDRSERTEAQVVDGWRRLHASNALVLHDVDAIVPTVRMAIPFAAEPTAHRVFANGSMWFANCALDAFGVCAAFGGNGRVVTACFDCGDTLSVKVTNGRPDDDRPVFHTLVPPRHLFRDIGYS